MSDNPVTAPHSDVAFSASVKAVQAARGSRRAYDHKAGGRDWESEISEGLKSFIESVTTAYLATASMDGQPYVQHRGGPPGFLKVLDAQTIGFVDFTGNRQYITTGNLAENDRVHLFLMDYTSRQRVKIWGRARIVEPDADLLARLMPDGYRARPEQVVLVTVSAWDMNCSQHIPQMIEVDTVRTALAERDQRIADLEERLAACN